MREARPSLVRLVRLLARSGADLEEGSDGPRLLLQDRPSQSVDATLLQEALSRGLLWRDGSRLCTTPAASAFLRRAALEPEDRFQNQHRDCDTRSLDVESRPASVRVNLAESPLSSLARLKEKDGRLWFPPSSLEAGLRLHADFTRGQLQPKLTMRYEPRLAAKSTGASHAAVDLSDSAMAARLRVSRAVEALGPDLSGVALDVCCFEKGLEVVERERQWPARSAKLMLRTALLALERHYTPPATPTRRPHHWGSEGFRPQMSDAFPSGT